MNLVQTWCPQRSPEIPQNPQRPPKTPKDPKRPQTTPQRLLKIPLDAHGHPETSREALEMSSKLCLTNRSRSCNGLPLCFLVIKDAVVTQSPQILQVPDITVFVYVLVIMPFLLTRCFSINFLYLIIRTTGK